MLNLFSPPLPFLSSKARGICIAGIQKILGIFCPPTAAEFFFSGILFIVLGQLSSLNLNWILFFMNWANSKTFRFFSYSEIYDLLLRLYQSHWLIILLLFFPPLVFISRRRPPFCRRREFLPKTSCVKRNVMYLCWISPRVSWNCVESYWVWWHNL